MSGAMTGFFADNNLTRLGRVFLKAETLKVLNENVSLPIAHVSISVCAKVDLCAVLPEFLLLLLRH